MSLERCVLYLCGLEHALCDGVCLSEGLIHITDSAVIGRSEVSLYIRMERELVDYLSFSRVL